MSPPGQPLTSLPAGTAARVVAIDLPAADRPRLMEMGLLVGTSVELVRFAARRSRLIVSGIIKVHLYPRAAQTKASPMPVLPLVGSRIIVSGLMSPAFSAASIIERPIRSFTL
jgi:Fe2+ transport system protein FeoA